MNPITLTYDYEHDIKLDLYLPKTEKPSLIVERLFIYMHGGGIESGDRTSPRSLFERLAEDGIAVASIDYRMYPQVKFPEFIEDCAKAINFLLNGSGYVFSEIYIGGSSAGAYLSMMLFFDKSYLAVYGIDPMNFAGWVFDAGQPTTHFNILRERGLDNRLVRIDDAAPFFYITKNFVPNQPDGNLPKLLIVTASGDISCRSEQLRLLEATLIHFGWKKERLKFAYMDGYSHCAYIDKPIFAELIEDLILYQV